jgi:hypothetical protein
MAGGANLLKQDLNATNKTGAIEYLNAVQGWPVDTNRLNGSGPMIRRYNRATVRWPNPWPFDSITFEIQNPVNTFSDMRYPIFQNGVQIAVQAGVGDGIRRTVTYPVTANGGQIDVWEPWSGRTGIPNDGTDKPIEGGYLTAAWLPPGYSITAGKCTEAVIVVGESIIGCVIPNSATFGNNEVFGVAGQIRLGAQAQGKLCVTLDYGGGTLMGDGISTAQYVALILQAIASVGAQRAVVHFNIGRNDWNANGSTVSTTPTQGAAVMQAIMNSLTASMGANIRFVVATQIPQTSEVAVNGFTLPQWRTAWLTLTTPSGSGGLQLVDSTAMGIIVGSGAGPAVDLGDGVHMNQFGVAKYYAKVKGPILGL